MKKIFPVKKILIFSIFAFIAASVFFAHHVRAAYTPFPGSGSSATGFDPYGQALREPGLNLEQFNLFNLDFTGFGLTKLLIGQPVLGTATPGPGGQAPSQNYGAFGIMSSYLAQMYSQKPVSGVEYLANLGKNFGIGKPAYAQGASRCPEAPTQGFDTLCPVQQLWTISRNLSYLAFVLIFVVIGFMIMLRARIDPRTVATVQAAIPGIVISLILVTLSFALAGLVIDLTQVVTQVIANALGPVANIDLDKLKTDNIFALVLGLTQPTQNAAQNVVKQIIDSIPGAVAAFLSAITDNVIGKSIIGLIFGILVVFTAFRVFIMLLTSLVTIVLMTIGAPFMFLAAAIPGRGGAVVGWFRTIGSAALTFPLTFLLLAMAAVFMGFGGTPWNVRHQVTDFNINLIPFGQFQPLDQNGNPTGAAPIPIAQMIGLGILLLTPKVSDMIREAFQQRVPEWAGEPMRAIRGVVGRVLPF